MKNDIVFYTFHKGGQLYVKDPLTGAKKLLRIINTDYVVNTTLDPISVDKQRYLNIQNIIKYIKENALIITIKCK